MISQLFLLWLVFSFFFQKTGPILLVGQIPILAVCCPIRSVVGSNTKTYVLVLKFGEIPFLDGSIPDCHGHMPRFHLKKKIWPLAASNGFSNANARRRTPGGRVPFPHDDLQSSRHRPSAKSELLVEQCHKPPKTGNGNHTSDKMLGDGLLLLYQHFTMYESKYVCIYLYIYICIIYTCHTYDYTYILHLDFVSYCIT